MRFDPFLPRVSDAVLCRDSLLCDTLIIPTVPCFRGLNESLRLKWLDAGEALANQQGSKALQIFLSAANLAVASNSALCGFLFDAAHRLLAAGCQTPADYCIQQGLNLLACDSERPESTFNGPLWLVMATSALICRNPDGCGAWLRQARQSLVHANENQRPLSQNLQHWNGDRFSIEACLLAGRGDLEEAGHLLSKAHQCHLQAGAFSSAAKDLILRSRQRSLDDQWENALRDLTEAQSLLNRPDSPTDDLSRNDVCRVIEGDLKRVQTKIRSLTAAKWN